MCKLLIMTGITEGRVAEEFMRRMAIPMSKSNAHGIGYSAVGPDGKLFSERWLNNEHFFSTKDVMTEKIAKQLAGFANRLPKDALEPNYSRLGIIDFPNVKSVTMHTRWATCGREFANTHPFIYEDTSLIHNGVIRNAFSGSYGSYSKGLDVNKISTCDSEAALQTYLKEGVNLDSAKAKGWLDLLTGGWAFGILSLSSEGNRILDVVRGTSMLYYMEIDGLGKVFTTDDDDAKAVVKDMDLKFLNEPQLLVADSMYRFNALTGELIQNIDIKPKYVREYGWVGRNSDYSKNRGSGTTTGSTASSPAKREPFRSPGLEEAFLLASAMGESDFKSVLPDIFHDSSTWNNPKIDYRKVKKFGENLAEPIMERLEVFDLVFNRGLLAFYEGLPADLKEYVKEHDRSQGFKAARSLLEELRSSKKPIVAG